MAYEDFVNRLEGRSRVHPVRKAIGNALITLGTGKIQPDKDNDLLDRLALMDYRESLKSRQPDPYKQAQIANLKSITENRGKPRVTTTESRIPFNQFTDAVKYAKATPEELAEEGLMTKIEPQRELFNPMTWFRKPTYEPTEIGQRLVSESTDIVRNPVRKSTRFLGFGDQMPEQPQQEDSGFSSEEKVFNSLLEQGYTEDEAYAILAKQGS